MTENNTPAETGGVERPALYTLSPEDLIAVSRTLNKLNELQKDNFLDLPEKIVVRSYDDWLAIGFVVSIDDGWFFEAITEDERETIGSV
jgi:hypothetical protein